LERNNRSCGPETRSRYFIFWVEKVKGYTFEINWVWNVSHILVFPAYALGSCYQGLLQSSWRSWNPLGKINSQVGLTTSVFGHCL
jgi:hypothetical protein